MLNTTSVSSTNTTEEVTALNASYTSGAASVRTTCQNQMMMMVLLVQKKSTWKLV